MLPVMTVLHGASIPNTDPCKTLQTWRTRILPVMIVLHGAGVNGNWMIQSLPFKEMADKHQVRHSGI